MKRIHWIDNGKLFVIRLGKTANKKITNGGEIIQTYTYSRFQWELANSGEQFTMKQFFALDKENCLDCPFSGNSGNGGCYTHKFQQYAGMLVQLRSIKTLPVWNDDMLSDIVTMCAGKYVRFGTYGEPSLLPLIVVQSISAVASNWTGYTHQSHTEWATPYSDYFMASTHDALQQNWRSFATITDGNVNAVICPASKEAGFKSNCRTCGLCSGWKGKGKKDVKINLH